MAGAGIAKLDRFRYRTPIMPMATIPQALEIAMQHHAAGRLAEAEAGYRQILARQPGHAGCLHLLGVIASQVGQHGSAVELIRRALQIQPDFADAHNNLGVALREQGRIDEAIAAYRHALQFRPGMRARVAASPLCDGRRFATHFMSLMRDVWRRLVLQTAPKDCGSDGV